MKSININDVIFRNATVEDAQSIVEINLQMWRTTYRN